MSQQRTLNKKRHQILPIYIQDNPDILVDSLRFIGAWGNKNLDFHCSLIYFFQVPVVVVATKKLHNRKRERKCKL